MKSDHTLLSGNTPLLLLSLLSEGDKYGYEMIDELARRSDETFLLKEGTLYPLLHGLEKEKFVESYIKESPSGRMRRYYHMTEAGRAQLERKTKEWLHYADKVNAVLGFMAPASN